MQSPHWFSIGKVLPHERHSKCVFARPQKFLKIKRLNLERVFLRRNQNIFASFCDAGKRSGFEVVVPSVFQKRFKRLPRLRKKLYLI